MEEIADAASIVPTKVRLFDQTRTFIVSERHNYWRYNYICMYVCMYVCMYSKFRYLQRQAKSCMA